MHFEPGEVVDVTIRATVVGVSADPDDLCEDLGFFYEAPGYAPSDYLDAEITLTQAVTVRRVIPAQGEPEPGDLWRDRQGREWFACIDKHSGATVLQGAKSQRPMWQDVNEDDGPLTLVHRPEQPAAKEAERDPHAWGELR